MSEVYALREKSHQKRILPTEKGIAGRVRRRRHTSVISNAFTFISNDPGDLCLVYMLYKYHYVVLISYAYIYIYLLCVCVY